MSEVKQQEKVYSRREVLKNAGKAAVGVAAVAVLPSFLTSCGEKTTEIPSKEVLSYEYLAASTDAPTYPYPYQKLDVATTKNALMLPFLTKEDVAERSLMPSSVN